MQHKFNLLGGLERANECRRSGGEGYDQKDIVQNFIPFIDYSSWKIDMHPLLREDQRLNAICREDFPGRGAYWPNPRGLMYLSSMENSILGYVVNVGSVAHVPGQEPGREQGAASCFRWMFRCQGVRLALSYQVPKSTFF